jgi:periplasmic protein TonB
VFGDEKTQRENGGIQPRRGLRLPKRHAWVSLQFAAEKDKAQANRLAARRSLQSQGGLAFVLLVGVIFGAVVGSKGGNRDMASPDDVFVIEEQVPQPPPPDPPAPPPPPSDPDPEPPKAAIVPEEEPPPQFGLTEETLGESGDLAVATGNTIMASADTVVLPPPPPRPPSPQMLDQPPRIVKGEAPDYPARALDMGLEGTVVALITTDTSGSVTDIVIEKSACRDFDKAVRKAAQATLFQPPVRQGRLVAARFRRAYEFKLE